MFSHFGKSNFAVRGIPFEISDRNSRPALQVGVNDELSSDVMSDSGIAVNYVLPKVFAEDLKEFYHNASIRHSMSILLDDALSISNSTGSHFHLVLSEGIMEIVAVADKELLLANHYQWQTESDILYFSAAVIEMLPEQEWIPHISGMMCESELEERLIRELFPHAEVSGDTDDNLKLTPLKTFCRCAS